MQTENMRRMAFPSFATSGEPFCRDTEGLSKLEYFTAAALQGLCACEETRSKDIPELAVTLARMTINLMEKDK